MAASGLSPEPSQEIFPWLKSMPLAPEYRPTLAEFQDPIAYIHKIEKEASQYGICKIVPPVAPALKKTAISHLNRSLLARNAAAGGSDSKPAPTFTTRQQQIGFCPRKQRPVQKAVWQSGEVYTFQEFEAKAKSFEKNYLKKYSRKGSPSSLEVETLYWKATLDKPLTVEYANDMPGSAFVPVKGRSSKELGEGVTVGETAWNMRGVSRAKGSLLRFMKEEIPGVTSPMLYIAMLFSWFAWHVEDHDLHSLNYLHMGAGKTWYGVPRDAAVAFEEVVRVHGYGGEINPLVTFSILGEKTTVVSPEVFISAGIPCCRLVQNAGEFVVTFPRAYHSGFSHEAANIATPEWLKFAKDAAIRRASINYPPMVSHFQLLYDLANELCSSSCGAPASVIKPRSSRLKDKKKSEVESLVKEQFVENVIQHNNLLHILGEGSAIVLLPEGSTDTSVCSDLRVGSQSRIDTKMTPLLSHYKEVSRPEKGLYGDDGIPGAKNDFNVEKGFRLLGGNFASPYERNKNFSLNKSDYMCNLPSLMKPCSKTENGVGGDALSDQRLFSCVTCGIVCFACAAIIQPKESAAIYLMSADCSFFNDWTVGSGVTRDDPTAVHCDAVQPEPNFSSRWTEDGTSYDFAAKPNSRQLLMENSNNGLASDPQKKDTSALVLLASTYGNSSDSEEEHNEDAAHSEDDMNLRNFPAETNHSDSKNHDHSLPRLEARDRHDADCDPQSTSGGDDIKWRSPQDFPVDEAVNYPSVRSTSLEDNTIVVSPNFRSACSTITPGTERLRVNKTMESGAVSTDEDSSRLHIFCLEHAVEVEQQLRPMGGVNVFLLCHPEYPKVESEAKLAAEELGIGHAWNDLSFRDASKEDEEKIRVALDSEEAIPGNRDWAVKLGINLFYSANLSRSILYSKQMAYNFVIYNAFGRTSPASSPTAMNIQGRRSSKQKKVVAGKWCGRVWMSTQVHPFLSEASDHQEQEKSAYDWALQEEIEKKPECAKKAEKVKMPRKSSRKRKMRTEVVSTKKVKAKKNEDVVSDHSLENIHNNPIPRYLQGKQPKHAENDDATSYNSLDDELHLESRRFSKRNDLKYSQREIDSSDVVDSCAKQRKRNIRCQRFKSVEKEDEISDDSPGYTSCEESGRIPVSWHANSVEREHSPLYEEEEEEEEEEQTSPRGKLIKNVAKDKADSTSLVPENSIKQYRRRRTMTRAKSIENEFKMPADVLEGRSYKQLKRMPRNQHRKCIERDNVFSDDSLEGNSLDDHRTFISKTSKFTDAVHSASDNSLGDDSLERHRISHGSKASEYDESEEDAVSYNSPDENGNYSDQFREISARSKKACYVEREDVSYDSCDADVPQHSRKITRNKRNSFYDQEDAGLYDSENNSSWKQQKKSRTREKARRGISQQPTLPDEVAQWSCRRKKQEPVEKRNSKHEQSIGDSDSCPEDDEMIGGPSTRLRKRVPKPLKKTDPKPKMKKPATNQKLKNASPAKASPVSKTKGKVRAEEGAYQCDIEGCSMSFTSKQELTLHKRNVCPVKGCGKKFFSHKYLVQHRRVHVDDRPLKCPWKGCKMTFKWAWARTEHIRVHTGARPYVCGEPGCAQTFRFVSDFSRHKRKTGHSGKKAKA